VKVGLLSDSHGRASTTQRAVRRLLDEGADLLLHLGDIGNVDVIDAMVDRIDRNGSLRPPVHVVFGNVDWDTAGLARYARSLGIEVDDPVGRLTLDGKSVSYQHGHVPAAMAQALAEGVDYLFHGHTHKTRDEQIGPTRVINPGALFRAADYTVALLDTATGEVRFLPVPDR
jgi:putative phosphoesterase